MMMIIGLYASVTKSWPKGKGRTDSRDRSR